MNQASIAETLPELWGALGETAWMVLWSFLLSGVLGIAVGIALRVTAPDGLRPRGGVYRVLGAIVNVFRSLPFLILMIALIGFTRLIVGTAYGPTAAIVPLTVGAIPFYARVVESALREVDAGKLEASEVMGATLGTTIWKVLLPEALPGILNSVIITLVTLVNYSAMAGAIGGGGLGDVGIRYGYQRFDPTVMLVTVVILVVLVQLIQSAGERLVKQCDHR